MTTCFPFVFLAVVLSVQAAPVQASKSEQPSKSLPADKTKPITLTGCLDQRGETFVLSSPTDMSKTTSLKGKTFSNDNFARFVGRKVSVRGTQVGEVFEVTAIKKIAESCSD